MPSIEAPRKRRGLHSLARDKAAIRHHYDVSNAFYRLMLGPTHGLLVRLLRRPDDTLEDAQARKLDLICRKLRLAPGERLLDIGCGWGSLLIHAAEHYGVRGVGVTLSEEQAELARERVARRRPRRPDRDPGRSDYRELARRAVRQDRQRRHVRARRPRRSSSATSRRCTRLLRARRAVPQPRHRAAALRAGRRERPSSTATSSPTASSHLVTDVVAALRAPASRSVTSSRCASTTR